MQQITSSIKYANGVQVFWTDAGQDLHGFFPYEDLIDMKINALDLLNNPHLYLVSGEAHRIEAAAPGCSFPSKTCEEEIFITRLFDAPREFIWKVWTVPEFIMMWWGPKGFTCPSCTIDLKAGGSYLYCMRSPEGKDFWSTGIFRELQPQERIVCTDSFADDKGNVVPATFYGMSAGFPREMTLTVSFEELGGRTRLTLRHAGIPAGKDKDQAREGWNESLDKFATVVARTTFRGNRAAQETGVGGKAG